MSGRAEVVTSPAEEKSARRNEMAAAASSMRTDAPIGGSSHGPRWPGAAGSVVI